MITGIPPGLRSLTAGSIGRLRGFGGTRQVNPALPIATSISLSPASASFALGKTQQFSAIVRDQFGQNMGLAATWTSNSGNVTVGAGTGLATGAAYGNATLTATYQAISNTASATVQQPTQLAVITQPTGATSGSAMTTQPIVELRDASNNQDAEIGRVVTVSIAAGTGTLTGTTAVATDNNGRAVFTNLTITATVPPSSFTLTFACPGLTGVSSSSFTVLAAGGFAKNANRPATYVTTFTDYGFNAVIPTGGDTPIGDGSVWRQVFNDGAARRVSDASAPTGPPFVLEQFIPAGSGSPTSSTGAGLIYCFPPTANTTGWYIQFAIYHDPTYEFNAISNKLLNVWNATNTGANIPEVSHFAGADNYPSQPLPDNVGDVLSWQFEAIAGVPYYRCNVFPAANKLKLSYLRGNWINIEILYEMGTSTGRLRMWVGKSDGSEGTSGELVFDYANINVPVGCSEIDINMTWGGASGPTHRSFYRHIDNIVIAGP